MRAGWNPTLKHALWAADPKATEIVEAVVVERSDIKDVPSDWQGADSFVGYLRLDTGGVILSPSTKLALDHSPTPDYDLTLLGPEKPISSVFVEWKSADDLQLRNVVVRVDPDVDGSGREVETWILKAFRVQSVGPEEGRVVLDYLGEQWVEETGSAVHDITFSYVQNGIGPDVGAGPVENYDAGPGGVNRPRSRPVTVFMLFALKGDGAAASNCSWRGKTGVGPSIDATGYFAEHWEVQDHEDQTVAEASTSGGGASLKVATITDAFPWIQVNAPSYTTATVTFTANLVDLGATPTGTITVVARAEEYSDSEVQFYISDDGGASWVRCYDGDQIGLDNASQGGGDLSSVAVQQSYAFKIVMNASSSGNVSPIVRVVGVEEFAETNLTGAATVEGATWGIDPRTCAGEVGEPRVVILKTGERDFRDYFTRLFSQNHTGQIQIRCFIGHPTLARRYWLHIDTWDVDDFIPGDSKGTVLCLSVLGRVRSYGDIPQFDPVTEKRTAVTYSGETLADVYADLIDSQIALDVRLRGPGIVATDTVSKTIRGSDAKDALDQVAFLAGEAVISSQGRLKTVRLLEDEGEERPAVFSFPIQELKPVSLSPGFSQRIEELFCKWGWDEDREEWAGESRAFNGTAVGKLRARGLDAPDEIPEETAQWIDNEGLADKVTKRGVKFFGQGVNLWEVVSTYPHPHLEPGDVGVVQTDQFVARNPITDEPIRGVVSARGTVVQQLDHWGHRWVIWIKSFADMRVTVDPVTREGFVKPAILRGEAVFGPDGSLVGRFQVNAGAQSVKALDDGTAIGGSDAFPDKPAVRAEAANAVDDDGWVEVTLAAAGSYDYQEDAWISALAYENADGTGAESAVLFKVKGTNPDDADTDAELTGLEISFTDDGDPVLTHIGDRDVAKCYANVGVGSVPADPTALSKDVTLNGQTASTTVTGKRTDVGQKVYVKVVCENSDGVVYGQVFGPYEKTRGDSNHVPPRVNVTAIRSGDTVTVVLTVSDPTLGASEPEFRKQPSDGTLDASWQTTWDSSTGTAGSDADLTRTEAVTSEPGLHAKFIWRVPFIDENGDTKYHGDEIDLASLEEVSKTLDFFPSMGLPKDDTLDFEMTSGAAIRRRTTGGTALTHKSVLPFPVGVLLTQVRQRLLRVNAGDTAEGRFKSSSNENTASTLATLTGSTGAGWGWQSASLNQLTATEELYFVENELDGASSSLDAAAGRIQVSYDMPSYDKSY